LFSTKKTQTAPAGFEPAAVWLTASRTTVVLQGKISPERPGGFEPPHRPWRAMLDKLTQAASRNRTDVSTLATWGIGHYTIAAIPPIKTANIARGSRTRRTPVSNPHVHAYCAICNQPILDDQDVVSIQRNLEHIEPSGFMTVKDSVLLASLCASCGPNYPEERIRVVFGN
jgi:hypothetical protein